ncbi:hypothetical protein ACPC54_07390 [Kitasatospora sp. NPDC094028]
MSHGSAAFLIGSAFAVLIALAFATVALGVITALRMPRPDDEHRQEQNNPV